MAEIERHLGLTINWDYKMLDKWKEVNIYQDVVRRTADISGHWELITRLDRLEQEKVRYMQPDERERWDDYSREKPSPGAYNWQFMRVVVWAIVVGWLVLGVALWLLSPRV
ncbi:MAG: hypothetical protein HY687_01620 [Chloroflexi bacterium]|nr:hypothetical protein [Chloroflexota bacterium]